MDKLGEGYGNLIEHLNNLNKNRCTTIDVDFDEYTKLLFFLESFKIQYTEKSLDYGEGFKRQIQLLNH